MNEKYASATEDERIELRGSSDFESPQTGSLVGDRRANIFAWQIAYLNSNPGTDITVQITPRKSYWRLAVAGFFQQSGVPIIACALLSLLAWISTTILVIRPHWLRAGSPGKLSVLVLRTFCEVQLIGPLGFLAVVVLLIGLISLIVYLNDIHYGLLVIPLLIALVVLAVMIVKKNGKTPVEAWREKLRINTLLVYSGIFMLLVIMLTIFVNWCEVI